MDILDGSDDNDDTIMADSNINNNIDSSLNDNNNNREGDGIDNDNDNDDVHMADSSLHDNNNNNNRNGDVINDIASTINHERLRALSNYADQNQDNASWYWNVGTVQHPPAGWPLYRPLSNLSDLEREDIRKGETRMISYKDQERYEGTGLSLDWGEYYVADDEMGSNSSEESSLSEAEEIDDEEQEREDRQAVSLAVNINTSQEPSAINFDQLDNNVTPSSPTLMGMPDIILEKILHYSTEQPSEVCVVERVCKRIHRLTTDEDFWRRHPSSKDRSSVFTIFRGRGSLYRRYGPTPRKAVFLYSGLRNIRKYQKGGSKFNRTNPYTILNVLRNEEEEDVVASTFRTLSADILSRMNYLGPEAHFRLRGDTIGYICELLQGYMIERFQMTMFLVRHRLGYGFFDLDRIRSIRLEEDPSPNATGNGDRCTVQRDDIKLVFQKDTFSPFFCGHSPQRPRRCDVATGDHGQGSDLVCSCFLPSSSGIIWKWPDDNCHDVLPPEAGRRIIRRLAYQAGIVKMSNEAFMLAEAEMLHALGILLVGAYESSVEMSKTAQFLDKEKEVSYNEPTLSIDIFKTPPPPFQDEQLIYTIVPGQIRAVAEERDITPSNVYGDVWVASSGFTKEEEEEIEQSYYYKDNKSSNEDDESEEVEGEEKSGTKQKEEPDDDGNDSDTSAWSESSVEDSELDMDDYEEDCYLAEYRFRRRHDIEAHYNHFPNPNNEDVDNGEGDNDEDMAVNNDA